MIKTPVRLELLAPARDLHTAMVAINSGADAVYIGADHHGARANASNSVADIRKLCEYAHRFRVKVYVTLNTLVYENELNIVRSLICQLYDAGVDALIVQDMAILEMEIPPIELHASTQCDIRTPEKALFMQQAGFEQLVLPREMSIKEILEVRKKTSVKLEAFVHGALCVSYSGDCRASFVNGGRTANRGECAQICRLAYNLIDGEGNRTLSNKHLLSLRDMNRLHHLETLIDAGVTSFKIEGRLKSVDYVRNVTLAYSEALNKIIDSSPELYIRASYGRIISDFVPDLSRSFNRGYTDYFLSDRPGKGELATFNTPKHVGVPVATVRQSNKNFLTINSKVPIANGDGLGYFEKNGEFKGFRVNRADGDRIYVTKQTLVIPSGTVLYRNYDKHFIDRLSSSKTKRIIHVEIAIEYISGSIRLTANDERGCRYTLVQPYKAEIAQSPQKTNRKKILVKTGDTIYNVTNVIDRVNDDVFIPASILTELRRRLLTGLDSAAAACYPIKLRIKPPEKISNAPAAADMHWNIANSLARNFYEKCGTRIEADALEVQPIGERDKEIHVMTTRYCLRRELGCCLKEPDGKKLAEPLTLIPQTDSVRSMRIEFDCKNCCMRLYALKKN